MRLHTKIPLSPQDTTIDYGSKVVLLGSCFAQHIGDKLDYFKFQHHCNPFGVLFHPFAIQRIVDRAINELAFTEDDIFLKDDRWHCLETHSLITTSNKEELLALLNQRLAELKKHLSDATHFVITLGSAWGYRHLATNRVVGNCHKLPQKEFSKELSEVAAISNCLQELFTGLKLLNKEVQIISTVSPVRHIKDGIIENSRSKAHLLAGLHALVSHEYFPSYELMLDEFRDYRFYDRDLVHPNDLAIDLIWNAFKEVWLDPATESVQQEVDGIQKGLHHKPFQPESASHKKFQAALQQRIKTLQERFPHLLFS
ncbi:MAG: GSCFA domain-containing protein [Flavobacteriaceae bacterium]|nr:GSCFA domain-containing protein [Flavobacteriaceae bacterium]